MPWYSDYIDITLLEKGVYPLAGRLVEIDDDALSRMAADYNDFNREQPRRFNHQPYHAPVVVGHPEDRDAASYGYVETLTENGRALRGKVLIRSESFRQLWKSGAYTRHEPQFFAPDNPHNPKPGSWFLKHVGFIGPLPNMSGVLQTSVPS